MPPLKTSESTPAPLVSAPPKAVTPLWLTVSVTGCATLVVTTPDTPLNDGTVTLKPARSRTPPLAATPPVPKALTLPSCSVPPVICVPPE